MISTDSHLSDVWSSAVGKCSKEDIIMRKDKGAFLDRVIQRSSNLRKTFGSRVDLKRVFRAKWDHNLGVDMAILCQVLHTSIREYGSDTFLSIIGYKLG